MYKDAPLGLSIWTASELNEILHWKLRDQYERQEDVRALNADAVVRVVTSLALNIAHEDDDYEVELRLRIFFPGRRPSCRLCTRSATPTVRSAWVPARPSRKLQ